MSFRKLTFEEKVKYKGFWPEGRDDYEYVVIDPINVTFKASFPCCNKPIDINVKVPTGFLSDGISLFNKCLDIERINMSLAWTWIVHDHLYETLELSVENCGGNKKKVNHRIGRYLADQVFLSAEDGGWTTWTMYQFLYFGWKTNLFDNYTPHKNQKIPKETTLHPLSNEFSGDELKLKLKECIEAKNCKIFYMKHSSKNHNR